jgi:hypothetical protein
MKMQSINLLCVLAATVVWTLLIVQTQEPRYQGRSLVSWLEQIAHPDFFKYEFSANNLRLNWINSFAYTAAKYGGYLLY